MGEASGGPGTAAKALRALAVLALALSATGGLGVPAAWADSASPAATKTNWWWTMTVPTVNGTTLPVGAPAAASTVPDGDLGVGYVTEQASSSDKAAAVALDLTSIPLGATFSSLTLELPYDPSAQQLAGGTPDISACELIAPFNDATGPSDYATLPAWSLPSCVKGTYKATIGSAGGYAFDLTAMANDWSGGAPSEGVLIQPTPMLATPQQPFSLAFQGKKGIKAQAAWTPASTPEPSVPAVVAPAPAPAPPTSGFAPQPVIPQVDAPAVLPPTVPTPQTNPVPTAAPYVAASYVPGALVPSTRWWLALLGIVALLGLTAVVLGDPMAPELGQSRRRRFAEAVRAAGVAGAGSHVATSRPAPRSRTV